MSFVTSHYLRNLHLKLGEKDEETEVVVMDHLASPVRWVLCQRLLLITLEEAEKIKIKQW